MLYPSFNANYELEKFKSETNFLLFLVLLKYPGANFRILEINKFLIISLNIPLEFNYM